MIQLATKSTLVEAAFWVSNITMVLRGVLSGQNSKSVKGANKSYTVTVSAGGYTFLTDYETLGIDADRIVGYIYKAGSYPIVLQFATEGIYLFSSSAISNKSISIKYFYV